MFELVVFAWIICPIIAGVVADKKNRSVLAWVGGTLLLGPLLLLILLATSPVELHKAERKCPYCAEWVKEEATVCKHCKKDLPAVSPVPPPDDLFIG